MIIMFYFETVPQLDFDRASYQVTENIQDASLALYACVILQQEIEAPFSAIFRSTSGTAQGSVTISCY